MSRKSITMFTIFSLMLLSTMIFTIATQPTYAQDASTTDIRINHLVTVYDGGMVIISDTVKLSKKTGQTPPAFSSFQLGFPNDFRSNIYQVWAYEGQNPEQRVASIDLDTGLGVEGFYGVNVHFTNPVDLNNVNSFSFTVVYEFSDLITENIVDSTISYNLALPVYPSLTQEASSCNSTVVFPSTAQYASSSPAFNLTTSGTPTLAREPLEAFTFESGNIEFMADSFSLIDMRDINREIALNDLDTIVVSDFYAATCNSNSTSTIWTLLPANASNIIAEDDIGNKLTVTSETVGNAVKATVTLKAPARQYQTAYFLVSFNLPWKNYVIENGWSDYTFKFKLFEPMNITVMNANVTLNLPEGSQFQSSDSAVQLNLLSSGIYSNTPVFSVSNISSSQDLEVEVEFKYAIFWSSFRPTLWVSALVAIVGVVAFLWQSVRAAAPAAVTVSTTLRIHPEELRNYVKTYEDITKLRRERESLETQARRGKIPRRLYRVRSRTIESRISLLSRDLATLRERISSAGPRYSDMMRQIEVANAELQAVEADIERTEARYRRGEISATAYHKLLEDYLKRKDRAQTNIDGILLRLREE